MQTKSEEKQLHWVVSREKVRVTNEWPGSRKWAEEKIAMICGVQSVPWKKDTALSHL